MAFSEMGTFHLCFILNWNKLINVMELCFTTDLWNKKLLFWCGERTGCLRFLDAPRTQGQRNCFIITCYWILKNDQVSLHTFCYVFVFPAVSSDTRPLAFSNHRALSGTPLPNLSGFPFPYLFALRKFLYLAFHFLFFFLIFSCNNHILNFTLRFSPITVPMLINLSFSRSIPPSCLPCIPCTSLLVCPVEGITMSLEDVLRTKLGCFLPHDFFLTASALGRAVSLCYWSSLWAAWSLGLTQGLVALSKTILPLFL